MDHPFAGAALFPPLVGPAPPHPWLRASSQRPDRNEVALFAARWNIEHFQRLLVEASEGPRRATLKRLMSDATDQLIDIERAHATATTREIPLGQNGDASDSMPRLP